MYYLLSYCKPGGTGMRAKSYTEWIKMMSLMKAKRILAMAVQPVTSTCTSRGQASLPTNPLSCLCLCWGSPQANSTSVVSSGYAFPSFSFFSCNKFGCINLLFKKILILSINILYQKEGIADKQWSWNECFARPFPFLLSSEKTGENSQILGTQNHQKQLFHQILRGDARYADAFHDVTMGRGSPHAFSEFGDRFNTAHTIACTLMVTLLKGEYGDSLRKSGHK